MAIIDVIGLVLPVLLLFALGAILRRIGFLAEGTVADLRRFVLAIALPSALFLTFLRVTLELRYLPIVVIVFLACVAMLVAGPRLAGLLGVRSPFAGPLLTGFEAGMLGYALYAGVFGRDELYRFGIVDLGQVLFVLFVLITMLTRRATGRAPGLGQTVATFLRTPLILAIGAGIVGNLVGLGPMLDSSPVTTAVLRALDLLAATTTPLIAIVIGYATRIRPGALSRPARTIAIRLTAWVILGLAFTKTVVEGALGLDPLFGAAVMTMVVLPPPFVIPIVMGNRPEDAGEQDYVADTLTIGTIVTLVAFPLVAAAYAV